MSFVTFALLSSQFLICRMNSRQQLSAEATLPGGTPRGWYPVVIECQGRCVLLMVFLAITCVDLGRLPFNNTKVSTMFCSPTFLAALQPATRCGTSATLMRHERFDDMAECMRCGQHPTSPWNSALTGEPTAKKEISTVRVSETRIITACTAVQDNTLQQRQMCPYRVPVSRSLS